MKIPEVRKALLRVADDLGNLTAAERIRTLVKELHRRPYVRKVAPRRKPPDPAAVRAYATANPDADYIEMAAHFETNTGRISEILAGFRK